MMILVFFIIPILIYPTVESGLGFRRSQLYMVAAVAILGVSIGYCLARKITLFSAITLVFLAFFLCLTVGTIIQALKRG